MTYRMEFGETLNTHADGPFSPLRGDGAARSAADWNAVSKLLDCMADNADSSDSGSEASSDWSDANEVLFVYCTDDDGFDRPGPEGVAVLDHICRHQLPNASAMKLMESWAAAINEQQSFVLPS